MNFRTPVLLLLVLVCMIPQGLFAQTDEALRKELDQFLNGFVQDYVSLPKTKNKQNFLKYFAKDATSNLFSYNISGSSRVSNSDYAGLDSYLDNIIRSSGITLGYEVTEKHYTYVSPNLATIVYRINYETKEENGIWVKGIETVTMALEKVGNAWLVMHYTVFQIEDEKLKGTCICELFIAETDDGEVVAKTTIPSGRSYNTKFDNFEFRTVGTEQIIRVGNASFKRKANGSLVQLEGDEEKELSISNSKKESVLSIILNSLYKDSCTRLKEK
ncbi:MAG: hypothetical protein EAZ89_19175 [Bacteroidetes bacterium]|nr:MAG: hypothetical protein EAZ89_19175 [Bacteroidota bacterium]